MLNRKKNLSLLISLFGVMLMTSGCIPSGGGGDELELSDVAGSGITGGPAGPVVPGGGVTPQGLTAEQAFSVALHPVIQSNSKTCKTCHNSGVGFAPFFAESNAVSAWNAINTSQKINLQVPSSSRIVAKVRNEAHNCSGAGCASDSADFEAAIINMSILMQAPSPTPDPTPGPGPGTTIPGLNSVEAFEASGIRGTVLSCASCHGDNGAQIPFAVSNLQNAHDAMVGLVDLSGPNAAPNSVIVNKILDGHQGFGTNVADQLEADIRLWWGLMQPQTVNPTPDIDGRLFSDPISLPEESMDASDPGMIYIEAESGALAAPFQVQNMGGVNGIISPNGNGGNVGPNATNSRAMYTFMIQEAGLYKILGRTIAPADADNSFHWRVDNNAFQAWGIPISSELSWDAFNNGGGTTNANDSTVQLTAGLHTLEIRQREDGTFLDQILITNQLNFVPQGAGDAASEVYELEFDISAMSGVPGSSLKFTIRSFDDDSYIVSNPTIVAGGPIRVKSLMLHVNNVYNANDSTYTIIDTVVPQGETLLAPYSMILLKGPTPPLDQFSVSFEMLQAN